MHERAIHLHGQSQQLLRRSHREGIASARRDALLFSGGAAIVALHAAVDSFFAPEKGTGAGDHLLRGVTTLAVLLAAVALYPRIRVGAQAAFAAVLGVLTLEGAVLAIADARAVGAHGEDWTGFFLLPTGLALLGLAIVLLWQSRKPRRPRYVRRGGIVLASALAAYWVVLPVAAAIFATHRPRAQVDAMDLGRPYENVTLRTSDGLDLAAWYVPSRNGAAVISFPTRKGKVPQARMLARHGYGVLLLDMRGYDGSEGDANMFGWGATKDIDAGVTWLQRRPDVRDSRIGGIGFSVGGEQMLEAAAENTGLRAVVSDGAGVRSVREATLRGARGLFSLPMEAVKTAALTILSGQGPPPSLVDLTPKIAPRPFMLIYAGHGSGGEDLQPQYYKAATGVNELWKIPEAGHTGGFKARTAEYERRVVGFFDGALLGKGSI